MPHMSHRPKLTFFVTLMLFAICIRKVVSRVVFEVMARLLKSIVNVGEVGQAISVLAPEATKGDVIFI